MQDLFLFKFLRFRLKQIGRAFKLAGWIPAVTIALFLLTMILLLGFHLPSRTYLVLPLYLLLTGLLQSARRDHEFLRKLSYSEKIVWGVEYNTIVLPVTLILLCYGQIGTAVAGHGLASAVTFFPTGQTHKKSNPTNPLIQWIPEKLFEWRCFFRKHKYFWPICYLLSILLSTYIFAVPLGLLMFFLIMPEAYNYLEPKELIHNYPATNRFLWAKLRDHSLFIHLLLCPLYSLFLFFHHSQWYVLVFFIISIESSICFGLAYKYAQFGNTTSAVHNQVPFLIFFSMIFFFPAALFYIYPFWNKATKALDRYA